MGNVAGKNYKEIKTYFMFNNFFLENRAVVYEIIWKNIESGKLNMIIWPTHITCLIRKATNTLSEYVILIAFPT